VKLKVGLSHKLQLQRDLLTFLNAIFPELLLQINRKLRLVTTGNKAGRRGARV
jgi:hypothetical protein